MRVLIALPDPQSAEKTLCFAAQIVCRIDEPVTILTILEEKTEDAFPLADAILTDFCQEATPAKLHMKQRWGTPGDEIVSEALEGQFDLIILGEDAPHRLSRHLQANVAQRVVEKAPCPVMLVKGETRPIRRLLVCDSGGSKPSLLSRFAAQLVELLQGEEDITVLHVMSQIGAGPGVSGENLRAEAEELIDQHTLEGDLLERDLTELTRPGIHPHPKVRHGLVEDEILHEAQGGEYDLVVIGMVRGDGWKRYLLEDLASKLLKQLDRPVLVVK